MYCFCVVQALKQMGYDEGDRNFGVEVPVEQQAQLWHNRWADRLHGSTAHSEAEQSCMMKTCLEQPLCIWMLIGQTC